MSTIEARMIGYGCAQIESGRGRMESKILTKHKQKPWILKLKFKVEGCWGHEANGSDLYDHGSR